MADHPVDSTRDRRQRCALSVGQKLREFGVVFDERFVTYLEPSGKVPAELLEAMRYSALAPGKRIRPFLLMRCCELAGGSEDQAWPVAAAIECAHSFSLIHDDLPAMDNDDLRRGQPTCHKRFGEAMAILAGDALVVLAFELLCRGVSDRALAAELMFELARAVGAAGMIGGQTADCLGEDKPSNLGLAQYIHERKTACLFAAACRMGAMVGGAKSDIVAKLGSFGSCLGQAFQIADDLLDVTATAEGLGKGVGKDVRAGKQTFPACIGVDKSRAEARNIVDCALLELDAFGPAADDLRALCHYVIERNY